MARFPLILTLIFTLLAACTEPPQEIVGPDGEVLGRVYRIDNRDYARIQFRMLDAINVMREARGVQKLELDPLLTSAAATHSRDMSVQNRPWHFGSDGSSPLDRVRRTGYEGKMLGENISETYETELETLAAWMQVPDTRAVILNPEARKMGFAWFQEPGGKIWWTLVTGD